MSLDYNYAACKGPSTHPADPAYIHPVLHALIMATMAIGMGQITQENREKFFKRLSAYQKATSPLIQFNTKRAYIVQEDVDQYIGLRTNVSLETDAWFKARLAEWLKDNEAWNPESKSAITIVAEHAAQLKKEKAV